jgi:hypothetical protein
MSNTSRGLPLTSSRIEQIFPILTPAQINRIAVHGHTRAIQPGEVLGTLVHSTGAFKDYGENLSDRSSSGGPSTISTADLLQGWVDEKNGYTVAPFNLDRDQAHTHYTQMVWKTTTQVGCGTATSGNSVYLACRYSPPGNMQGESPY